MPLPSVWGPHLWNTLHGLGARCGKAQEKTRADEAREARWLIDHLESIIPCAECRTHVKEFKKTQPIPGHVSEYSEWLWRLHDSVNERLCKIDRPPFTPDLGLKINIRESWKVYVYTLRDSLLRGDVKGVYVKDYTRHIGLWLGFSG